MNSKGNPILIEMASQLPEASKLYQFVMTSENYSSIFDQAREDFLSFAELESIVNLERKTGYGEYLRQLLESGEVD